MKKLIQGNVEFRKQLRPEYRETFARLALGQSPDALLIACSDSRMVPNLFASTEEPGDMFVLRNAGNIISPCAEDGRSVSDEPEAGAIEFAAYGLNVPDIIVCGHSECGAMRMLVEGKRDLPAPHLYAWLRHAEGALKQVREGARMNAELPLHNHLSQFTSSTSSPTCGPPPSCASPSPPASSASTRGGSTSPRPRSRTKPSASSASS